MNFIVDVLDDPPVLRARARVHGTTVFEYSGAPSEMPEVPNVLTSGLTFMTVLALFIWGGAVLNSFAFALVVGILVGTYSSVFIASPILIALQGILEGRKRSRTVSAAPAKKVSMKGSAKVAR